MAPKDEETLDVGMETAAWEFLEPPLTEDVAERLANLEPWWGVQPVTLIEYVQALSQKKNVSPDPSVKDYKTVWTLYMSVAGRIAALNKVAQVNKWRVDIVPEPNTPTGIPGFLEAGDRIVYREYVVVYAQNESTGEWYEFGRRPGTAWVPRDGGAGAVASNRYEKVETSARGRAIAAWGIGVLPGSGVASLDEMVTAADLARGGERGARRQAKREQKSRPDLEADLRTSLEEYQQATGITDEGLDRKVEAYCDRAFGLHPAKTADGGWDFQPFKDGQLVLFTNRMRQELDKFKTENDEL